jgi:molybdate transport system substrate-binding protein
VLLNAKSIGAPNSTSAPFISGELMERLGIPKDADGKLKLINPVPLIQSGELEMGIAPMSELVGYAGIRVVGILPEAVQLRSVFSAGVAKNAQHPVEAKALIDYLSSREALPIIEESGLRATSR